MKEATTKLLTKKKEAMRSEQVTEFLDQLKNNSNGLNHFIREFNKEQKMSSGKS